jgi:hypothetical protein
VSDNTHIFLIAAVSDVLDAPVQKVDFSAHNAAYRANRDRLEAMSYWQRLAESIADLFRGRRPEDSFPPPIVTSVPLRTRLEQHHATASDRWQITDALLGDLLQIDPAVFVAQHTLRRAELDPDDVSLIQLPPALQGRWQRACGEEGGTAEPLSEAARLFDLPGVALFTVTEARALAAVVPELASILDASPGAQWVLVANFPP